jgi:hypothetical protein
MTGGSRWIVFARSYGRAGRRSQKVFCAQGKTRLRPRNQCAISARLLMVHFRASSGGVVTWRKQGLSARAWSGMHVVRTYARLQAHVAIAHVHGVGAHGVPVQFGASPANNENSLVKTSIEPGAGGTFGPGLRRVASRCNSAGGAAGSRRSTARPRGDERSANKHVFGSRAGVVLPPWARARVGRPKRPEAR